MNGQLVETPAGLSAKEVQERVDTGRINTLPNDPVRSLGEIVRANVFNPVNAIMITLFVLIMIANSPGDALFVGVVLSNSIIGIAQELRAKKELEHLAVLNTPKAQVIRDSKSHEIAMDAVVADDVLEIKSGDQIIVDGEVISGLGMELDESLLTGESVNIQKEPGDELLSGSFVAAGSGYMRATKIGKDSYASKLSEEARRFSLVKSELRLGINWVLKILMFMIPPVTIALFFSLLINDESAWQGDLRSTVAAAVAMVPDGLVLLTSLAFLTGVIALARQKALAKELATVELLARVDVLCLDKTGTITTGAIAFGSIDLAPDFSEDFATHALGAFAVADPNPNSTMLAVAENFEPHTQGWTPVHIEPFSSARKWSAVEYEENGLFYFGAPDILLPDGHPTLERAEEHTLEGRRVLALCHSAHSFDKDSNGLPEDLQPVVLVLLEDNIRPDANEIFGYFQERGVQLKVISGDTVNTVAVVAERAGIKGARQKAIDARELPEDDPEALEELLQENIVFGRVTPHQKRSMVKALQARGHTVAMTGDGVNDVLALKDSDMGISMGSGSSATRAVAQLVLLDNKFATLPKVLIESRKVINNVERVANLFLSKAVYAVLLTLGVAILSAEFPFIPRHLTLIGTFSIGLPGLILVLAPSAERVKKNFINRTLAFAIPAGCIAAMGTGLTYGLAGGNIDIPLEESRTIATITLLGISLFILGTTARPFVLWKALLVVAMQFLYILILAIPFGREYFQFELPNELWIWVVTAITIFVCGILVMLIPKILPKLTWLRNKI